MSQDHHSLALLILSLERAAASLAAHAGRRTATVKVATDELSELSTQMREAAVRLRELHRALTEKEKAA